MATAPLPCPEAMAQPAVFSRPTAPKLFSHKTLAYFRIDDTREFKTKLGETSIGRLAA